MDAAVQWSADCLAEGAVLLGVAIVVIARRPVFNRPIAPSIAMAVARDL